MDDFDVGSSATLNAAHVLDGIHVGGRIKLEDIAALEIHVNVKNLKIICTNHWNVGPIE